MPTQASFQHWDGEKHWEELLGWFPHSKHCGFNPDSLVMFGKAPGLSFSHIARRRLSLYYGCDCWLHSGLMWWHHWQTWGKLGEMKAQWGTWQESYPLFSGSQDLSQRGRGVTGPFTHYQLYSTHLPCLLEYADNSICSSYDMAVVSWIPIQTSRLSTRCQSKRSSLST